METNDDDGDRTSANNYNDTGSNSEPCIFKLHNLLRDVNNKAYEPEIVAIGPYHRGKFQFMEGHKSRFRKLMLDRKKEASQTRYVEEMKPLEQKARKSYAESTAHIPSPDFLEMLVSDGIFIIELLWKFKRFVGDRKTLGSLDEDGQNIRDDPLFKMQWAVSLLQRDLMLFENQLPFFILVKLFEMVRPPGDLDLVHFALFFFNDLFPGHGIGSGVAEEMKHLLDLIHKHWGTNQVPGVNHNGTSNMDNFEHIRCSTKLREAGIQIVAIKNKVNSFHIEFENGELRIPILTIEGRTESLLRNLIAFEEYCGDGRFHNVTDYMAFFSCLIKTKEDVARLTRCGVLQSFISDYQVTIRMFNTINDSITGPSENFQYNDLFLRVNGHCKKRYNRYMAILKLDHLSNPWRIVSVIAGTVLLLLTFLGTLFQILSWKQKDR